MRTLRSWVPFHGEGIADYGKKTIVVVLTRLSVFARKGSSCVLFSAKGPRKMRGFYIQNFKVLQNLILVSDSCPSFLWITGVNF